MMEHLNQKKRREILEAALKLFSEHGFERTSVATIAVRANVGKGTVYLYFSNKEEILMAIVETGLTELIGLFKKLTQSGSYSEQLQKLVTANLKFIDDNRDFYHILLQKRVNLGFPNHELLPDYLFKMHLEFHEMLSDFMRKGVDCGFLRPGPPELYGAFLSGIVINSAFHWLLFEETQPLALKTEQLLNLFLHGVQNPNSNYLSGGVHNVS